MNILNTLSLSKCVNGKPECKCTYHVDMWFTELTMLTLLYILYIYIYMRLKALALSDFMVTISI